MQTETKPLRDMTIAELETERMFWQEKVENATSWGASYNFARKQLLQCDDLLIVKRAALDRPRGFD